MEAAGVDWTQDQEAFRSFEEEAERIVPSPAFPFQLDVLERPTGIS